MNDKIRKLEILFDSTEKHLIIALDVTYLALLDRILEGGMV